MNSRQAFAHPMRVQRLLLATLLVLAATAALAAVALLNKHAAAPTRHRTVSLATTPVVIGTKTTPTSSPADTPHAPAAARRIARQFLASYLPVLYGRRPARTIRDADAHLRAALRIAPQPPMPSRNRRPHVTALRLEPQGGGSALALATIADGVSAPYKLVFTLGRQHGRWCVTELANY